jgi:acetyl-CoA acetyltransferase
VPITVPVKSGTRVVDGNEHPRAGTTADALTKLRVAFLPNRGTATAGNASGSTTAPRQSP